MFVEKLSQGDVAEFLMQNGCTGGDRGRIFGLSLCFEKLNPVLYVSFESGKKNDDIKNLSLYDFKASKLNEYWVRFLGRKFGKDYKKAYMQDCIAIYNTKG
jgi:hypothetical protein